MEMVLLRSISELASVPGPVVLAIGVFDGLHLGHRAVLERA
ncbi:MAG: riboflavin biosynthesis protein RibF, partial [Proteobacteria bacterium]|nr:riboflavin biosynthesis protein RibF [Pseudomonadota bacterium]